MAIAGNLTVALGLNSAKFREGLDKSGKQARNFSNKAKKDFTDLRNNIGKLVAAVGGITAAFTTMSQGIRKAEELQRFSVLTNTSTKELQVLMGVANQYGIQNEKLADQLKDVNDKVHDFLQNDSGPMKDFFDNIAPQVGVTAEMFRNLSGPQSLQLYVDSLQKANLSQEQMTFYMEALVSDATNLIPIFQNGGAAIKQYGDNARELGLIINDDVIKNVKTMSDTWEIFRTQTIAKLMNSMDGFFIAINNGMRVVIENFDQFVNAGRGAAVALGVLIGAKAISGIINLAKAMRVATLAQLGLNAAIKLIPGLIIGLGAIVGAFYDDFKTVTLQTVDLVKAKWDKLVVGIELVLTKMGYDIKAIFIDIVNSIIQSYNFLAEKLGGDTFDLIDTTGDQENVKQLRLQFEALGEQVENLRAKRNESLFNLGGKIGEGAKSIISLPEVADVSGTSLEVPATIIPQVTEKTVMVGQQAVTEAGRKFQSQLDGVLNSTIKGRREHIEYGKSLKTLEKAYEDGVIDLDTYSEAVFGLEDNFSTSMDKMGENMDKVKTKTEELQEAFKGMGDGLSRTLREGGNVGDFFANKITGAFDKIADSFFNNAIDSVVGSLFGGGSSGGSGGGFGSIISSGISSIFGGFFADGGRLDGGKFGIVGEEGPEIVTGPANITPMNKLGLGSGITVQQMVVNNNITADDFDSAWTQAATKNADQLHALNRQVEGYT